MKWAVMILVVLGIVAAVCASVLVTVMANPGGDDDSKLLKVIVAGEALPAMTVLTAGDVVLDEVSAGSLPKGYMREQAQAAGRILAVPVVAGQILTSKCFVSEGSGAQLAASIPAGSRAVSIPVPKYSVMAGLLYPGCMVDVIASFKLRTRKGIEGEALSTTLLQNVQVLAIENASIVSQEESEERSRKSSSNSSRNLSVTLMVDTQQAEALQLAMENGTVSLAMRNPRDKAAIDSDATVLNQGQLARLGSVLPPAVFASIAENVDLDGYASEGAIDEGGERIVAAAVEEVVEAEVIEEQKAQWRVTVIRGEEIEEEVFELAEAVN